MAKRFADLSDAEILALAATTVAFLVVAVELLAISWIRNRYMDTPFVAASMQVILGGAPVFAAGILLGSS